jgi:hypothetical protein
MTARLVWRRELPKLLYTAPCGEEGQGRVRVEYRDLAWEWSLDMLPGDAEPVIRGRQFHGEAFDRAGQAMRVAEKQVDAWPALVDGAVRG